MGARRLGARRWLVVGAFAVGALVAVSAVLELVRTGDSTGLGVLAVVPGVCVAALSNRGSTSRCSLPWPRRHGR